MQKATWLLRIPFIVAAYKVTAEDMKDIEVWCKGQIIPESANQKTFIRVPVDRPANRKETEAYIGMWVLLSEKHGHGRKNDSFKVYNEDWIRRNFIVVPREIDRDNREPAQLAPVIQPIAEQTPICCMHDRVGGNVRSLPTQGGHGKNQANVR